MRQGVPTYALYGEDRSALGDFWIHSESIPARSSVNHWEIRPHKHEAFFQFLDIRGGDGELLLPDRTISIGRGGLVTVPPERVHGFRFSPDIDGNVLTFVLSRLPVVPVAALMDGPLVHGLDEGDDDARLVRDLVGRVNTHVAAGFGIDGEFVRACLSAAMILIGRIGAVGERPAGDAQRDHARIDKLKTLIALHFRQQRPVDFYAEKLALTPAHLNRICRKISGRSVGQLVAERVIEEARRDLVFTSMTVQQIAFDLGFSDPAYFNRLFSRQTGITPKAYRTREQQRLSDGN
jgi:AraC family transcriptional regulator, transcriptional activator of pobA